MALAAFDTLEVVDELEKAGIPEKQARAISSAVRKSHESLDVATKADLQHLEERVDTKLEKLGTELRHEIGDLRKDNELLRKDMDTKHESLRKDMDAKHESLRKDMELMFARFEKRLLLVGVTLGALSLFGQDVLSILLRLFH